MQGPHTDRFTWSAWDYPPARRRATVWLALDMVGAATGLDRSGALAVLRTRALAQGVYVEDVADDLMSGALDPVQLVA